MSMELLRGHCCRRPKDVNVLNNVLKAQLSGNMDKKHIKISLPLRRVNLESVVPSEEILAHVFLGFTQNGQHLISYKIDDNSLTLFVWVFRIHEKLVLKSCHVVYQFSQGHDVSLLARDYYDSTALSIYQWPKDDHHLLIFVVPDHPLPDVISVCVINTSTSSILEPGLLTFSVVGWGQRYKFIEDKDKLCFEDVLTPGLVFTSRGKCTFHTGSEVVSLAIEPAYDLKSELLISKTFDVEFLLGNLIEGGTEENYIRLITYELFVFGIHDSGKSTEIDTFIHAVTQESGCYGFKNFREFTLTWNVANDSYDVKQSKVVGKESETTKLPEEPKYSLVFKHMCDTFHVNQRIHFLDNMHFVENQLSYDSIRSPSEAVVIELGSSGPISQDDL